MKVDIHNKPQGSFQSALSETRKGDEIIYHIGPYCAGHHKGEAMWAYGHGYAQLVQRKITPRIFEYIAQRTAKRF